jgi:5-formyltetrahydrofolate cyclo-ligase
MTLCAEKKRDVRLLLKVKRAAISLERRREASQLLFSSLLPQLGRFKCILSFQSLFDEIDTSLINIQLAKEKRLLLPKICGNSLLAYHVNDPLKELESNPWNLCEPNPSFCLLAELEKIDCILVPGLGFDKKMQRIGYGKGHYDRFLCALPQTKRCASKRVYRARPQTWNLSCSNSKFGAARGIKYIGLGFKEQLFDEELPSEEHDMPLDDVILY